MNYHQGDIYLKRIKTIPEGAKQIRRNIVARGEITGHTHEIEDCTIYERDGVMYISTSKDAPMTHQEHPPTMPVERGFYEIIQQEEYFPDGFRKVED